MNDEAHPRACGENRGFLSSYCWALGSSPRMRGKHVVELLRTEIERLIPAHAGKTSGPHGEVIKVGAHPRACGENIAQVAFATSHAGSSPRMRGKPCRARHDHCQSGLIPAHAGKTRAHTRNRLPVRAHPRACGENMEADQVESVAEGSSPRMRGKRKLTMSTQARNGLIPAHAGKTIESDSESIRVAAHPRACGENVLTVSTGRKETGSSPRMRGKPEA